MNREIKFRAWDSAGFMIQPSNDDYIAFSGEKYTYADRKYDTPNKEIEPMNPCVLMQYTGLKDKNGIEIYEGDISMPGKGEIFWHEEQAMFKVKWHDEVWKRTRTGFASEKDGRYIGSEPLLMNPLAFEVIGNIYKNPELLTN